jgi:hypothetical protein
MMRRLGIAQKERFWKIEDILKHNFEGRMRGAIGTYSRKPQILLWIYDRF